MGRWRIWGRVLAGLVVAGATGSLLVLAPDGGGGDEGRTSPPDRHPAPAKAFTVAVVTRHAHEDRAAAARIALAELRRLLRDNKSPGTLPLEFVAVRPREGLTYEELRAAHPRLVAVIADEPSKELSGAASVPVIGTCRIEHPGGLDPTFRQTVAPEIPEVGWELRAYLAKRHDTRTLTVLGAYGMAKDTADQLSAGVVGPEFEELKLPGVPVFSERPTLLTRKELRAAVDGHGEAVFLTGTLDLDKDLPALARAGFRGPVLYSPGLENDCGEPWDDPPVRVPDGITLYRVDTVAPGPVREKDCKTGNTERCPWLVRLPDRAGAVEEYEAAQALVRIYRTAWVDGKNTIPDRPDAMADELEERVDGQIVRGLSGWFEMGGPKGRGYTLGFGHDVWLHRWAGHGRWTNLGPVSAAW